MPDRMLTLLDMAKRSGSDLTVGLIDEVNTVAPELGSLMGRPINGITYKYSKRTTLPGKDRTIFRDANEGTFSVASTYESMTGSCYFADIPLIVDEAVIRSGMAEGATQEQIMADESAGTFREAIIKIGDQFYNGKTADAKGFVGLKDLYDSSLEVSAGGSSGSATSAWLVWNDIQGVHWVWGNNMPIQAGDWSRQMLIKDGKNYFGWVNNIRGYIGLSMGNSKSIGRIKLITSAAPLTDALGHELIAKLPIFMRTSPGLRWFMNSQAQLLLQKSRSVVNIGTKNDAAANRLSSGILNFAPTPTELAGIPIILTDSIPSNE